MANKKVKALSLLSGGLDSILAVKVLQEQGIEVVGITFTSPFFGSANAEKGAAALGIELVIMDITEEEIALIKNPPHGFGKQMNPCIDCHALMVRKACSVLKERNYDFIATGEVLGERPMSQNRQSLDTVARDSGCGGLLLRPLSAKLLPPTAMETQGIVDREKLLSIEGRSRKPQMRLAEKFGIRDYIQPAGGCLLTDPSFSQRLKELMRVEPNFSTSDVYLLRVGRHFRLQSGAKAVVGRDENDNKRVIDSAQQSDVLIVSDIIPGPAVLLRHSTGSSDVNVAAQMCASFADNQGEEIDMELKEAGRSQRIKARPAPRSDFDGMRI